MGQWRRKEEVSGAVGGIDEWGSGSGVKLNCRTHVRACTATRYHEPPVQGLNCTDVQI